MTLGQLLKNKRIEQGKSLQQVAASTKIHIKILTAIEEDAYADLPARTFTRGFIVNYTKALRLDSDQVMKDYHEFLEQKFNDRPDRDQGHQGYAFEGKELEQNKRWMVVGASIAAIFAISVLLIFKPQNHKHKEKHKEFEEESVDANQPLDETEMPGSTKMGSATTAAVATGSGTSTAINASLANSSSLPATSSSVPPMIAATSSVVATASVSPTSKIPSSTPAVKASATPAAKATATPAPKAPSPTPAPSASPSTDASTSPTPKPDKLNKGDNLDLKEVKRKITIQAKDDIWVRYQSDELPIGIIILRKGRVLVIKAKNRLSFEVNHPESARYKTKSANYQDLGLAHGEVIEDQSIKEDAQKSLGAPLPADVPASTQVQ